LRGEEGESVCSCAERRGRASALPLLVLRVPQPVNAGRRCLCAALTECFLCFLCFLCLVFLVAFTDVCGSATGAVP